MLCPIVASIKALIEATLSPQRRWYGITFGRIQRSATDAGGTNALSRDMCCERRGVLDVFILSGVTAVPNTIANAPAPGTGCCIDFHMKILLRPLVVAAS